MSASLDVIDAYMRGIESEAPAARLRTADALAATPAGSNGADSTGADSSRPFARLSVRTANHGAAPLDANAPAASSGGPGADAVSMR